MLQILQVSMNRIIRAIVNLIKLRGIVNNIHYIANVAGIVSADTGSIDLPLICDWPNRPKQKVCYQYGKASLTHYQVLQRSADHSRLKLTPITGRSHQLRVHLQWLGHPILGDKFYAAEADFLAAPASPTDV